MCQNILFLHHLNPPRLCVAAQKAGCARAALDVKFEGRETGGSSVLRPLQAPLKFTVRGRRETVRLKISGAQFEAPPPSGRPTKQLVTWHFHPVLPFVLGVLQTANSPPQALIYHRL